MTAEGPLLSAVINRMPDEVVMLAALGIVFALAFIIESPIVNLLATSTALVRDRPSFEVTRRFTLRWMLVLTGVGVLVGFGPLFSPVVEQWLGTPPEIARWVRPGLQITALISTPLLRLYLFAVQDADPAVAERAWFGLVLCLPLPALAVVVLWLQGQLIHRARTAAVNLATVVQLAVLAVGLPVAQAGKAPGLPAAVVGMQGSMIAQAAVMASRLRPQRSACRS